MRFINALGNKHYNLNTTRNINAFRIIPLGIFTIVMALPHNALAFESTLPVSYSKRFLASIQIQRAYAAEFALPVAASHSFSTQAIAAAPSPVTEPGSWPAPTRLAYGTLPIAPLATLPAAAALVTPTTATPLVLEGEASYYSRAGCLGCSPTMTMANGQPLDDNALTMAIGADKKHLVGRTARVTSLATGQSTMVRITDTGGFYKAKYGNRVADLTIATKTAIGMKGGVGQVRVEVF